MLKKTYTHARDIVVDILKMFAPKKMSNGEIWKEYGNFEVLGVKPIIRSCIGICQITKSLSLNHKHIFRKKNSKKIKGKKNRPMYWFDDETKYNGESVLKKRKRDSANVKEDNPKKKRKIDVPVKVFNKKIEETKMDVMRKNLNDLERDLRKSKFCVEEKIKIVVNVISSIFSIISNLKSRNIMIVLKKHDILYVLKRKSQLIDVFYDGSEYFGNEDLYRGKFPFEKNILFLMDFVKGFKFLFVEAGYNEFYADILEECISDNPKIDKLLQKILKEINSISLELS